MTNSLKFSNFTSEQQAAISRLFEYDNTLLIASKGFGKCAVAWTAAQELIEEGSLKRVLVIAPPKVCALTWATEHEVWEHLWTPGLALKGAAHRRAIIEGPAEIVILSADCVAWFVKTYGKNHGFDGLIIDEVSRFKSVGGKAVKALRRITPGFAWKVGLSATPVAESGRDVYAQALLLDDGAALGRNQDRFLRSYFVPDYSGYKWEPQIGSQERLAEALSGLVHVVTSTEYEDSLPPLYEEVVEVEMGDAYTVYEELAQTMIFESEDLEAANAAVLAGKLQQVASGFVYREDGSAVFLHEEKYMALEDLVDGIEGSVVIMYQFIEELRTLRAMYPGAVVLAEDPLAALTAWNAGTVDVLLLHPRSAGHGLNLQHGGHTMIALGPCWSSDQWDQVIGRLWRRGQKHAVTRYTLVCHSTIDRSILLRLKEKKSTEGILMDHLREVTQH